MEIRATTGNGAEPREKGGNAPAPGGEQPSLENSKIGDRSEQEQKTMLEKVAFVARVFSKTYDLEVVPSGGGWACTISRESIQAVDEYLRGARSTLDDLPEDAFRATTLLYDASDLLNKPQDVILGVTRHEVAHVLHTDFKLFFEGQRMAEVSGYMPTTWAQLHNALEDVWINIKECADSEVVHDQMMKLYAHHFPEIVEKINTQPLIRQLGLNINYYWLHGENIPTLTDKRVLEVMSKVQPHVDQYFWGESPLANYENLRDNIWPLARELEERSLDDEMMKEMSRRLSGKNLGGKGNQRGEQGSRQSGGQGSQQQQQGQGQEDKSLAGRLSRAMDKVKRGLGMKPKGEKQDDELTEKLKRAAAGEMKPEEVERLKEELDKQLGELEKTDEALEKLEEQSGQLPPDIDLDKLPPELKDALQKAVAGLPENLRKELEKKAEENLDRKQAESLDSPKGMAAEKDPSSGKHKVNFKKPPSSREVDKARREAEKAQKAEDEARSESSPEGAEGGHEDQAEDLESKELRDMKEAGFDGKERELYREFRRLETEVAQQANGLIRKLSESIPCVEERIYTGEHYSGRKLNRKALAKHIPVGDPRVYGRPEYVPTEQARMYLELLIDNSGSMMGDKMDAARKAAVALGRMAKHFGMPMSIKLFAEGVSEMMSFEEDYDDPRHKVKPKLMKMTDASGGATNIGAPLRAARDGMVAGRRRYPGSIGAVFVVSDSGANQGLTGEPLKRLISDMQKDFVVVSFVLSDQKYDVDASVRYFGERNVVAPRLFHDLPYEAGKVLASIFERFMKRYSEGS